MNVWISRFSPSRPPGSSRLDPDDPLADVLVALTHVTRIADGVMSTSLEEALATLERRAATTA